MDKVEQKNRKGYLKGNRELEDSRKRFHDLHSPDTREDLKANRELQDPIKRFLVPPFLAMRKDLKGNRETGDSRKRFHDLYSPDTREDLKANRELQDPIERFPVPTSLDLRKGEPVAKRLRTVTNKPQGSSKLQDPRVKVMDRDYYISVPVYSRDVGRKVEKKQSMKENHGNAASLHQLFKHWASMSTDGGTSVNVCTPQTPVRWKTGKFLGAGAFGKVYKCNAIWPCEFKVGRAVKIVKIEPQYTEMPKEVKAIKNEINILENLRHERIVSFYGSEERDGHLHLFMDYMAGGSLSDQIKLHKVLFESVSRRYTKQILEGVRYLHSKHIIHRDIKGSNVLLDGAGNVKLADFGLSKIIQKIGSKTDLVSHCGTPHWMAPEIIRGKGYGRKADIWSVGCTVVEMLTGRPPLGHLESVAAIFQIGSQPTVATLPEGVSQDAKKFIQAALTWDPIERPWSEELLEHNFVSDSTEW